MRSVSGRRTHLVQRRGSCDVKGYWGHWPCVFPQHGPGKKHAQVIALVDWQAAVVRNHPGPLLRGLFHSDGWRGTNVSVVHRGSQVRRYEYTRYQLTNHSGDILDICCQALDALGISWRRTGLRTVSVSQRAAVAALDEHVGPKH